MRPHGKGPLDSLYFAYPMFPPTPTAEQRGEHRRHRVAIIGAGPIGMTAALTLARYGVACVLIEKKETFNDGSRALCIARPSMHILERIGAVEPFLAKGLGWQHGRSFYRGSQIYRLEMAHGPNDKYMPMYNLQQQYIEQYLHDAVARTPLVDMRWHSELAGLESADEGVSLAIRSPLGDYNLEADWVLAADGARSPLRSMLGLRLKGANHEGRYVIADVRMALDLPTERRAYFEPASNPGGTLLLHKQPDDLWRLDYQLRDDEDEATAIDETHLRRRIQAILDDIGHRGGWELEWWSIYTANTLCLDDYRHGRVFFIGDAAHIVPIFGVRGLNNGLADAHNIGWKLARVITGKADPRLLETYTAERRGATLDVFANATRSTRFMTPPTQGWKLAREAALSLAVRHDYTRHLANPRQMQPFSYSDSPVTIYREREAAFDGGPARGDHAANVRLSDGRFLLDLAGDGFTAILFGDGSADGLATRLDAALRPFDADLTIVSIDCRSDGHRTSVDGQTVARVYDAGPGTLYLLRPDLHVAGRWKSCAIAEAVDTLKACLGLVEWKADAT